MKSDKNEKVRVKNQVIKEIKKAKKVLIATHLFPDADGIGSSYALSLALKKLGKSSQFFLQDKVPKRFQSIVKLPSHFSKSSSLPYDLAIIVDTHSLSRLESGIKEKIKEAKVIIFIDHHPLRFKITSSKKESQKKFIYYLDSHVAASGELIAELLLSLKINFTKVMASALYMAMTIDSSSFRYPNVTSRTHLIISKLLDSKINPAKLYKTLYQYEGTSRLKLLAKLLSRVKVVLNGRVSLMVIKRSDLHQFNIDEEETNSFINHLLNIKGAELAMMVRELPEGKVKVALRSHGSFDAGSFAFKLGGGGHFHSSAIIMIGKVEVVIKKVLTEAKRSLQI